MRFLTLIILMLVKPLPLFPMTFAEMRTHVLAAIIEVEDAKEPHKPGKAGELTRYQFKPDVWRQYSRVPMDQADHWEVERVAVKHYNWCFEAQGNLRSLYDKSIPYSIAMLWNAGYGNIRRGTLTPRHLSYAKRVENIVSERISRTGNK